MSIPQDTFFTVTPATNPRSKATGTLNGVDYFFYIAENGDLRVKTFSGVQSYTLDVNTRWMDTIQGVDTIHVYYSRDSLIFHIPFQNFGQSNGVPVNTGLGSAFTTFSTNYAANTTVSATPTPAYLLLLDDGISHNLYAASDADFHNVLGTKRTFSNIVDPAYYVRRPMISIHPEDTNICTVNVQRIKVSDGSSQVGFLVVRIPGVD